MNTSKLKRKNLKKKLSGENVCRNGKKFEN